MPTFFVKFFFTLLLSLSAATAFAQTPAIQWQKCLGGMRNDHARAIDQTVDGGYIIAGYSESNDGDLTNNQGDYDYWVVKLSNTGAIEWQKSLGGTGADFATALQQTTDGGYIIAGQSNSTDGDVTGNHGDRDYWVVKLNDTGAVQWQKSLGGTGADVAYFIRQTTDGGYIVAGQSNSNDGDIMGNHGGWNSWVVKMNAAGTIQWQKSLGGTGYDDAYSIQQTADGGSIVAGGSNSNDGDVTGNHGNADYWVVKLNNIGIIQWQKSLGGTEADFATSIQQTTDGSYIVAGGTESINGDVSGNHDKINYWVVKLNSTGTIQWQKLLGGTGSESARVIQQTADGGYIVAGGSNSNDGDVTGNHGDWDCWLVKLNDTGAVEWQKSMGGTSTDGSYFIKETTDGGYMLAGYSYYNDGDVAGNHGNFDYWIVKLGPDPTRILNPTLAEKISIYPNPAANEVSIESNKAIRSVIVTGISGQEVWRISGNTTPNITIPIAHLANGFYLVRVATGSGTTIHKLTVQHP